MGPAGWMSWSGTAHAGGTWRPPKNPPPVMLRPSHLRCRPLRYRADRRLNAVRSLNTQAGARDRRSPAQA